MMLRFLYEDITRELVERGRSFTLFSFCIEIITAAARESVKSEAWSAKYQSTLSTFEADFSATYEKKGKKKSSPRCVKH